MSAAGPPGEPGAGAEPGPGAEPAPGAATRVSAAALRAAVDGYFAALAALDVEATVALFAPGATLECVTDGRSPRGHEELRAFFHGVVDGSRGMVHPVVWIAVDEAAGSVATVQEYRDERDTGAVYEERTCNVFGFDGEGRITRLRFWRGKRA